MGIGVDSAQGIAAVNRLEYFEYCFVLVMRRQMAPALTMHPLCALASL
jgi:hypothetical protein